MLKNLNCAVILISGLTICVSTLVSGQPPTQGRDTNSATSAIHNASRTQQSAQQSSLVESLVRSSSLIVLARHGHSDPFASELVVERYHDIVRIAEESVEYHIANHEMGDAREEVHKAINSAVFTFSTDAHYILSDSKKDLHEQRRQFNAFLSLAETQFEQAIVDMAIPDAAADAGRESFRKTGDAAYDYFERPRIALLDTVRSQQRMSVDLVRLQKKLENRLVDFERTAIPYLQVLTNDPKDLNLARLKNATETYGKAFADTAMLNFAAGNGAFRDPNSPINAIAPSESQGVSAAGGYGLMFDYTPESGFDALSILQDYWNDPLATMDPTR